MMDNQLITDFHVAFHAEKTRAQQTRVLDAFCAKLRTKQQDSVADLAADARAILWLVQQKWGSTTDLPDTVLRTLKDIKAGEGKVPARKEHAVKKLIARWSGEKVQHYRFSLLGEAALRGLVQVAEVYGDWHHFVVAANSAMLWRHVQFASCNAADKNKHQFPIGQYPSKCLSGAPHRPLLPSDIERIKQGTPADFATRERLQLWTSCTTCLEKSIRSDGPRAQVPVKFLLLKKDKHDMLVQATRPQATCTQCCPPSHLSSTNQKRKGPEHRPHREPPPQPAPDTHASLSPPPTETETQMRLEDAATALQEQVSSLASTTNDAETRGVVLTCRTQSDPAALDSQTTAPPLGDPPQARGAQVRWHQCIACQGQCKRCNVPGGYSSSEAAELYEIAHQVHWGNSDGETSFDVLLSFIHFAEPVCDLTAAVGDSTARAWFLPWKDPLMDYLENCTGPLPELLVIRKEKFADSARYSPQMYAHMLRLYCGGNNIPTRVDSEPGLEFCDGEEIAKHLMGESAQLRDKTVNVLSLDGITNAIKPSFTRFLRFRFLQALVHRAKANDSGHAGKQIYKTPFDVSSCMDFNILGFTGAYSGAHVDLLGATWLRNLFGTKLWWYVPRSAMSDEDWNHFRDQGSEWNPRDKAKAVLLKPGDVLVMFEPVVHIVYTVDTCLMEGGMFCDSTRPVAFINHVKDVVTMPEISNEPLAYQLPIVIEELEKSMSREESSLEKDNTIQAIASLRETRCVCKICGPSCSCRERRVRCSKWCEGHPEVPPNGRGRQCMRVD